jgi:hypothetical protein
MTIADLSMALVAQFAHHKLEWLGAVLGVAGSYVLAENRPSSRFAWPMWIASNLCLIVYFISIASWGVLAMQFFYLHSSLRGFRRAFGRSAP